jgi:amino acid efflux transporter
VCLIGATYVTDLVGGGTPLRCGIAAALLLAVLVLAAGGLRASTTAQLVLVSLLTVAIVVAAAGSAPHAMAANWLPFAPHGWSSVGRAASTLMFSFVGWEAVAPLTGRFRDPARQLPRVIGTTLAVTTVIYLGLAIATIAVLGRAAATDVPLAGLLVRAVGGDGRVVAAAVAVVLTLGTTNAYLSGAVAMTRNFARRPGGSPILFLAAIALAGAVLLGLYGAGLVTTAQLVGLPTTLFLAVYLGCTISAARTLRGTARACAAVAAAGVVLLLAFCGWTIGAAAAVAIPVMLVSHRRSRRLFLPKSMHKGRTAPHLRLRPVTIMDLRVHFRRPMVATVRSRGRYGTRIARGVAARALTGQPGNRARVK